MKMLSPKQDREYSEIYNVSRKYIPYTWLASIGLKNVHREKFTYVLMGYGIPIVMSISVLFISYVWRSYPDKTPFYLVFLVIVAFSAWLGGLKSGWLTTGIIAAGAILFFFSPLPIAVFLVSGITISFLIDISLRANTIQKLNKQEEVYAQTFIELHN